jgi:xanthine dehydrogenase small subunit
MHFLFNNVALKGIVQEGNQCIIGAASTITDLMASPVFKEVVPEFEQFAWLIASVPIRNIATLAGNFVNASPIGDLSVLFLALEATIQLREGAATRQVRLRDFFKGYKQLDKTPGEHMEKILVDMPVQGSYIHFEKVSKRRNLDIATVNTAIKLVVRDGVIDHCSLAAGGVAPVPAYLAQTSAFLEGKKITEALVEEAALMAQQEITPISDARGTAAYKKQLLGQLIKAHFITLFPWLNITYLLQPANGDV